jgi:hypothetical protein
MSDNSNCFFNRYKIRIYNNSIFNPLGGDTIVFEIANGDWEVLSNREFYSKIVKSICIKGDTNQFLKFLTKTLPLIRDFFPVIVVSEPNKFSFLEKMYDFVDGISFDIKLPLKHSYNKEDRVQFKNEGEYRTPLRYCESVVKYIGMYDKKKFTSICLDKNSLSDNLDTTKTFLSNNFKSKLVVV